MKKIILILTLVFSLFATSCSFCVASDGYCDSILDQPYIFNGVTYSWYSYYYTGVLIPYREHFYFDIPIEYRGYRPPRCPVGNFSSHPMMPREGMVITQGVNDRSRHYSGGGRVPSVSSNHSTQNGPNRMPSNSGRRAQVQQSPPQRGGGSFRPNVTSNGRLGSPSGMGRRR